MRPNIIFLFFIIYLTDLNFFHTTAAKKSALLRRIIVYVYGKLLKLPYTRRAMGTTIALNMHASAVLVSGLVGFGLGATPNAMANMSAVCLRYALRRPPVHHRPHHRCNVRRHHQHRHNHPLPESGLGQKKEASGEFRRLQ